MKDRLCAEIDNEIDLRNISKRLQELDNTTSIVYMCFSTDIMRARHRRRLRTTSKADGAWRNISSAADTGK